MARLYSNENFPLPVVEELRRLNHDVLTIQEVGLANQAVPDEEILTFAQSQGRIVLTNNRKHFIRLHAQQPNHFGIIVCTFDPNFSALAQRIHSTLEAQPDMSGKLIRINRPPK